MSSTRKTFRPTGFARRRAERAQEEERAGTSGPAPEHPSERPWHHLPDGTFRNPPGCENRGGKQRLKHVGPYFLEMMKLGTKKVDVPEGHVVPRGEAVRALAEHAESDRDFLTWVGHACFLIRMGGYTILTDPYLTAYAGPKGVGPRRFVKAGVPVSALPPIDLLVISHNHYDHLDERALAQLPGKDRMTVLAPLRLGDFFRERGFANVVELDWHECHDLDGLAVTALPVVHWSRRSGWDTNRTLWAGFAFKTEGHHLFFGGDSAYGPIFEELGEQYGPFDTALLGIGAYAPREMMHASHATPEEAVRMGRELKAARLVGMHWGTVLLTIEPPFEPPARFMLAGTNGGYERDDLWIMRIGETRLLAGDWPSNR